MSSSVGSVRTRLTAMPSWVCWLLITVLFAVLASIVTARYVYVHPALSPIDEYNYVDAVDKASRGVLAREGQTVDGLAREAASCRGFGLEQESVTYSGTCGVDEPLDVYPWNGHSTAGVHSPVYYFTTAWMAKAIMAVLPGLSLITAARLTGALWLAVGMLVLAYLLRRVGEASWLMVGALPLLIAAMPGFRVTNSYISPDAPNLLCGSLVFLAALLYAKREWALWPFVVVSMVVTLVKFQNCFAVVAAVIFLLWYRMRPGEPDKGASGSEQRLRLPFVLVPVAAALAVGLGWMWLKEQLRVPSQQLTGDPAGQVDLARSLFYADDSLLGLFTSNWPAATQASVFPSLALWGAIAALVAVAWLLPGVEPLRRRFAQAGAVSLLGIGPAVNVAFAAVFGSAVAMQPRYAMVLIPMLAIPAAWALRSRGVQIAVATLAVLAYVFGAWTLHVN
ncbi:hypothetical protein [Actinomyces sp.]|uniref:hypothetical protein n=1 Tax=Actinomyces sp. TaxID=29317 RepID=UPI0026DC0E26|nr:hypothetical protein [Actinomyces sp.]MDO4899384.1 hypothetical protein [Actinomyces sp.]